MSKEFKNTHREILEKSIPDFVKKAIVEKAKAAERRRCVILLQGLAEDAKVGRLDFEKHTCFRAAYVRGTQEHAYNYAANLIMGEDGEGGEE